MIWKTHSHKLSLKGDGTEIKFVPYEREEKRGERKKYKLSISTHMKNFILSPTRIYSVELPPPSHWPPSSIVRSRDAKGRHFYRHKDAQSASASVSVHLSISSVDCRHHYATFRLTEGVLAPLCTGGVNRPENTYTWRGLIPVVGRRRGGTILLLSFRTMKKIFALFFDLVPFRRLIILLQR